MRTIEINAFQFEELDSQTQEKVIENNRTINVDSDFWCQCELDNYKTELKIKVNEFDIYRRTINITIEDSFETAEKIINFFGKKSSIVYIAKTFIRDRDTLVKKYGEGNEKDGYGVKEEFWSDYDEEIEYLEEEFRREIAEEILSMLTRDYEYETSDDGIKETILANEYEFTEDGERI
tara:strand:- start:36441 stop:36974 length:534 start_codon:yes stop_codon:yes gene_type:complete